MNKIRVKSRVASKRNREDDVIDLIQKIINLKVASQYYLSEYGYCCKNGAFGKEFIDFMHNNGIENLCDESCTNCRVKYYNFIQEFMVKRLSERYQVDFDKVMGGLSEYE